MIESMGLKKNVLYSGFLTSSLYIFQFITYPYVSRVLGVNGIGICNFTQTIVHYFILLSTLGITSIGIREIAKYKNDNVHLNKVFSGIFQINAILTFFVLLLYIVLIEILPQLVPYRRLLYIGVVQIIFNTLSIEWLFKGLENFKYITIRTFWVKILYVISVFVFIRDEGDYDLYFAIIVGSVVVNGIVNWRYGTHLVKYTWQPLREICKQYVRPLLLLGAQIFLQMLYTDFIVIYLGFVSGDTQVGLYTTATKIFSIVLALYSSFTLVMMPRISSLCADGNYAQIRILTNKSFSLLYAFAFPCIFLLMVFARETIGIISGSDYEGAVLLLKIAAPIILVAGIEQILILQLILPLRMDKALFYNSIAGATIGLILIFSLIPSLLSAGAVVAWGVSECIVLLSACYFLSKRISNVVDIKMAFNYFISYLPLCGIFIISAYLFSNRYIAFVFSLLVMGIYSHINLLFFLRNEIYIGVLEQVKNKFRKSIKSNKIER